MGVTLISLVSGLQSLYTLWLGRADEQQTIATSITAAAAMADSEVYRLAWEQLDRVAGLATEPELLEHRVAIAMPWVRWLTFQSMREQNYEKITELVLPYLYRGLNDAASHPAFDIRAHIAWASYLRDLANGAGSDSVPMLEEVVAQDPDNLYGNTMLGFLTGRSKGPEGLAEITARFDAADTRGDVTWANSLQWSTLDNLLRESTQRSSFSIETQQRIASRYVAASARSPEKVSSNSSPLRTWLYFMDDADTPVLNQLAEAAPPDPYIEILETIYQSTPPSPAARYLLARLEQKRGNVEAAEAHYGEALQARKPTLKAMATAALSEMTGRPVASEPDPGRGYFTDTKPEGMVPWRFHADTLSNFNFAWRGDNFNDALDFFDAIAPAPTREIYVQQLGVLRRARDRVKEHVDGGRRWLLQAGPSEQVEQDLVVPHWNLSAVWYLVGRVAAVNADWDTSITEWTDLYPNLADGVSLDWELAIAHGTRAQETDDSTPGSTAQDVQQSLFYLESFIQRMRRDNEAIAWQELHAEHAFRVLHGEPRYRELVRGRL